MSWGCRGWQTAAGFRRNIAGSNLLAGPPHGPVRQSLTYAQGMPDSLRILLCAAKRRSARADVGIRHCERGQARIILGDTVVCL
jgi:hypothetical protein